MPIESYQPPEPEEEARLGVLTSMILRCAMYERSDLEGLFKKFNEGEKTDEV